MLAFVMQRFLFLFICYLLILIACQKPQKGAISADWSDYKKGYAFLNHNNDSAFFYFNHLTVTSKDSGQIAIAYNVMAALQSDAGDLFGAQESLTQSLRYLDEHSAQSAATFTNNYNELGLSNIRLKNYSAALKYFELALRFANDHKAKLSALNNKGLAYQEKGDYAQAIRIYNLALSQSPQPKTYARILTNLATTRWLQSAGYNAAPDLLKAFTIRQKENDRWGQNSSYSHLADFYTARKPDSALYYARKMLAIATELQSPDDRLEALEKIIKAGPAPVLKSYFILYRRLADSIQSARNSSKNQFALIRYDAEKAKANSLRLEKDLAENRYELGKRNVMLIGVLAGTLILVLAGSYTYRKKRKQAVQQNQLQMSKKVHDGVANRLYGLIQDLDNHETVDKDLMAVQLNVLYERSRDISHEPAMYTDQDFAAKIKQLLGAFSNTDLIVAIVGNDQACWEGIGVVVREELELVLLEWMVNMKKHSRASHVGIRFERTAQQLMVVYTDNGVGLPAKINYGKGLRHTGNRIQELGGSLIFDTKLEKGVRIELTLPLNQPAYDV